VRLTESVRQDTNDVAMQVIVDSKHIALDRVAREGIVHAHVAVDEAVVMGSAIAAHGSNTSAGRLDASITLVGVGFVI